MACETVLRNKNQTRAERKKEVRDAAKALGQSLAMGLVKARVGPQGAITFEGWNNKDGVSDACALRLIMAEGSGAAKLAIAKAEQLAGRKISSQALNSGVHSHDGGKTWNSGH